MHLQRLAIKAFDSLPDQQIELDRGVNILVDTTRSWKGWLSAIVSGALFGLTDDARARLQTAGKEASVELSLAAGANQYNLSAVLRPDGDGFRVEAVPLGQPDSGNGVRPQPEPAYREEAATAEALIMDGQGAPLTPLEAGLIVTDLQSELETAVQRLNTERQEASYLLDYITLKSLSEKVTKAKQLVAELSGLERELRTNPAMDRSLTDDVAAAKSLESHIASMTKVIEMKEEKLKGLREQFEQQRGKLEFYEYLRGIGTSEVSLVKRSLERKRWLLEDLQKLETEIEHGNKRLSTVAGMVAKYDRLEPFLGPREMDLDRLEEQLDRLKSRLPTQKLLQAEAERRALRLQIHYWRRRRFISGLLSVAVLPFGYLWPPIALLSVVGLSFMYKYWSEITALVNKMAAVVDRLDYLTLERNEVAAEIKSLEAEIEAIHEQTGTASASELHDKIDDYQRLRAELEDLKREAAQREKARDELRLRLSEEERRAGALFDRVGLSAELTQEAVDKFAEMVSSRIDDERTLDDIGRRVEEAQAEIDGLQRQVGVLQRRLDRILAVRRVGSVAELQHLMAMIESQDVVKLYRQKGEELQTLLNGQKLADIEARVEMLTRLVPSEGRIREIPAGVTPDHLEARLESIRARSDLLKWLKGSVLPLVAEGLGSTDLSDLEMRQVCLDLCLVGRVRQLLVLAEDEQSESVLRSVALDVGIPVTTVVLDKDGSSAADAADSGDAMGSVDSGDDAGAIGADDTAATASEDEPPEGDMI